MIPSKLAFFEMQDKFIGVNSIEFCQPSFAESPKTFDAVDMTFTTSEFVL